MAGTKPNSKPRLLKKRFVWLYEATDLSKKEHNVEQHIFGSIEDARAEAVREIVHDFGSTYTVNDRTDDREEYEGSGVVITLERMPVQ